MRRHMAVHRNAHNEKIGLEAYGAILEKDPEHRYEYLDGDVYMMTGGSPTHSIIGGNMVRLLGNLLEGRRCIVYNSDLYVELAENYRVCPDVTVSCDSRDRGAKDAIHYPSLIVEVLSPSTEAQDRGRKALAYRASQTIQEYLLISSETPVIELVRREKNGFWTLYTLRPDDIVDITSLSIRFPVAKAYENTVLLEEQGS